MRDSYALEVYVNSTISYIDSAINSDHIYSYIHDIDRSCININKR